VQLFPSLDDAHNPPGTVEIMRGMAPPGTISTTAIRRYRPQHDPGIFAAACMTMKRSSEKWVRI